MDNVESPAPRATVRREAGYLLVAIPARRNWALMLFLPIWLVGWAIGLVVATGMLSIFSAVPVTGFAETASLFLLAWLAMWLFGGLVALYTLAYTAAGREELRISEMTLRLQRRIGPLPAGRARTYDLQHASRLRTEPTPMPPWWARRRGTPEPKPIAFDYGAKTVRFGAGLDEAEARQLVEQIAEYSPALRRP